MHTILLLFHAHFFRSLAYLVVVCLLLSRIFRCKFFFYFRQPTTHPNVSVTHTFSVCSLHNMCDSMSRVHCVRMGVFCIESMRWWWIIALRTLSHLMWTFLSSTFFFNTFHLHRVYHISIVVVELLRIFDVLIKFHSNERRRGGWRAQPKITTTKNLNK